MSAVDAPPGLDYAGLAAGEFAAPVAKRRLARRVFFLVLIAGAITISLAGRHPHRAGAHVLLGAPLFLLAVAGLGWSVRRARLHVVDQHVRWGWSLLGFRMRRARLKWVRAYADAVALRPKRGSIWYLAARDWDDFGSLPSAFEAAGIDVEHHERNAPVWARLQSYGRFLDVLMILDAVVAILALAAAIAA